MTVERCTVEGCPWYGYTDTKKCWAHSRGEEPEAPTRDLTEPPGPQTFGEALADDEAWRHGG